MASLQAFRLQSLVRKQKEQKIYDGLRPFSSCSDLGSLDRYKRQSILFAQQRFRMRNAKNALKKLKQEAKEAWPCHALQARS